MKFAHIADCHVGGWKEEKLKELSILAFEQAIDKCIEENAAFVLIAGDLFNTALPNIDIIKRVAASLSKLRNYDIDVYAIPGSHDFSPSGKSVLDILEHAGLLHNVVKFQDNKLLFTLDKTNVKIAGLHGKRLGLDKIDYENLDKTNLEKEQGFKIFLFHALLNEFKPRAFEHIQGHNIESLPRNFNYYAGGHPHFIDYKVKNNRLISYPGPLFPNNFSELEELKHGGFYIVDDKLNIKRININIKDVITINIDANDKNPGQVENEIIKSIKDYNNKIVTIRIEGILKEGKPGDIDFKKIFSKFEDAYAILKNTYKLTSKEFENFEVKQGSIEEIELSLIKENIKDFKEQLVHNLIEELSKDKHEGETSKDFEDRLFKDIIKVLNLEDLWHVN